MFASLAEEPEGRVGTPAFSAKVFAVILSPIFFMAFAEGPTHLIPAFFTLFAKLAFSDKNPYPGCIASTLFFLAISKISLAFKYESESLKD